MRKVHLGVYYFFAKILAIPFFEISPYMKYVNPEKRKLVSENPPDMASPIIQGNSIEIAIIFAVLFFMFMYVLHLMDLMNLYGMNT